MGRDVVGVVLFAGVSVAFMSLRLDPSWSVLASWESSDRFRCVDVFSRPDGSFGFEEFRRDPEDMGAWTPVAYFSGAVYVSRADVEHAAKQAVPWMADERP
jgi:hypothetical protein